MTGFVQELIAQIKAEGFRGRVVSIDHLSELRDEIMERKDKQFFDQDFFKERLTFFTF